MTDEGRDTGGSLVSSDVRKRNLAVVAEALARSGALSRSEIAAATGLTRGAVTLLTGALIEAGVVRETDRAEGTVRGRPRTLLELSADTLALLALQLDADTATAVLTTISGGELARFVEHHGRPMGDPEAVLDVLARVLRLSLEEASARHRTIVDSTVVAFAPVGGEPPVVIADTDLGWGAVDVLDGLARRSPEAPTSRLVSDSTVAARAEAARLDGVSDALYLKSNSGIGGAIISSGELVLGAHGMAGAHGHLALDFDGALCECGQRGCLVTVAGPDVVLEHAGLGALLAAEGLTRALEEFVSRVTTGDQQATRVWADACIWIARAVEILTLSFDPEVVVLGGYWAAPALVEGIRRAFDAVGPTLTASAGIRKPPIVAGVLGEDAALLGAIESARDRLLSDPLKLASALG